MQIPLTAYENHMFGPVKSVAYKYYTIAEKDGSKNLNDSGYNVYDKFGHLVAQNEYKADGTLNWKCIYQYDANNKPVKWDFTFEDPSQKKITTFRYNDKDKRIEDSMFGINRKYESRTTYKYDDKGNDTEKIKYSADGKTMFTETYRYDSRGYQSEYIMKTADKRMDVRVLLAHDNNGNDTSRIAYRYDTIMDGTGKSVYDSKGQCIEEIEYDKDGVSRGSVKLKYDDWDNITETLQYKPDGAIDTARRNTYTTYEYDSHGNAIKETDFLLKSGKKVMTDITERKFEYYQ